MTRTPQTPRTSRTPQQAGYSAQQILRRFSSLQEARAPFERLWDEVAHYMGSACKRYGGFSSPLTPPVQTKNDVLDSTARRAANIFAAGMLSGVSSPSQQWFRLGIEEVDLREYPQVRTWLQAVEDRLYAALSRYGFYPQQTLGYHQAGLFGWQCLFVDETPAGGIRFRALPLAEIYIDENHQGEVDTVFRHFRLTARQAAQKWGTAALSQTIRTALDRGRSSQEFYFLHAVYPHPQQQAEPDGLAYVSCYMEATGRHFISQGGYKQLPYIVTRSHRLPGSVYSYSPGTEALADVKMINEMKRLILEAGQLAVAPPYLVPDDGFVGRFSFQPRAMNYYRRAEGNSRADFGPLAVGGEPRFSWELLNATKQDINEAFFVDLFLTIRNRVQMGATPTAAEVTELANERLFLLGPLLINQQQENFRKLFDRLFHLMHRRGELPPVPRELAGRELEAQYTSPLMLAQKEAQTQAVLQTYTEVARIGAAAPEVLDLLDHDENVRRIMAQRGFPQTGMRSQKEVAHLRTQRQKQQEQAQQLQTLEQLASLYPNLNSQAAPDSPAKLLENALKEGTQSMTQEKTPDSL